MLLKVQRTDNNLTSNALIESGFDGAENKRITFHAYSDYMKARILEQIAKGAPYVVAFCDDLARDGEWLEDPIQPTS